MAYCRDHFIRRELRVGFVEGASPAGWTTCRQVMAALGAEAVSLPELKRRTGLPESTIRAELERLGRIGAVASNGWSAKVKLWWRALAPPQKIWPRRRAEHMVVRAAALMVLAEPRRSCEVAAAVGYGAGAMNDLLQDLLHGGQIVRVGQGRYAAVPEARNGQAPAPLIQSWAGSRRPQPVRDAILSALSQPCRAVDIARAVGRTVPNVTGHLQAMLRRGLVERVGYGRYARPSTPGLPPSGERCFLRPGTPPAGAGA